MEGHSENSEASGIAMEGHSENPKPRGPRWKVVPKIRKCRGSRWEVIPKIRRCRGRGEDSPGKMRSIKVFKRTPLAIALSAKGTTLLSPGQRPGTRRRKRPHHGVRVLKGRPSTPRLDGREGDEASRIAPSGLWEIGVWTLALDPGFHHGLRRIVPLALRKVAGKAECFCVMIHQTFVVTFLR